MAFGNRMDICCHQFSKQIQIYWSTKQFNISVFLQTGLIWQLLSITPDVYETQPTGISFNIVESARILGECRDSFVSLLVPSIPTPLLRFPLHGRGSGPNSIWSYILMHKTEQRATAPFGVSDIGYMGMVLACPSLALEAQRFEAYFWSLGNVATEPQSCCVLTHSMSWDTWLHIILT